MAEDVSRTLFLALADAFSCLASELAKRNMVAVPDLVQTMQETADGHTRIGNTAQAGFLRAISNHLVETTKRV